MEYHNKLRCPDCGSINTVSKVMGVGPNEGTMGVFCKKCRKRSYVVPLERALATCNDENW